VAHRDQVVVVTGNAPKTCPDHGEPTDVKGDTPVYCLDCDRAVRATGHSCWRHIKRATQAEVEAKQKAEDEETERRKTFAERMHRNGLAKKELKEAMAQLTPEQRADAKERDLALKALRKAQKLRKKLGLKDKPR
jgi:hypothetical protein